MCKLIVSISLYWFAVIAVFADTSIVNNNSFCIIQEPVLKTFTYNFTSLSDPTKDIILPIAQLNETLRIQLCTPLKQKCNGTDGYGICLIKDKQEIGIGKSPPIVNVGNGKTSFMFTGTNCTQTDKYSVTITMKCNYTIENNSIPELSRHEKGCEYHLLWRSALACSQRIQQNCTVTNNGSHYDLSPLTKYSDNYVIHTGNENSPKIILNVCHNVIFEYNALCQPKSGACLQQNSSKVEYMNLGDVTRAPFFEDGKLKIKYQNGDVCRRNIATPDIQTTISFICDFEAIETSPEYIGGSEECRYQIIWKTSTACSIESLRSRSAITAGRCTVTNPLTNFTYNLQSLMKEDYYATAQNDIRYKFGVCKSPTNTACGSETGICSVKNGTSMGKYNTNLIWQEGGPYLNYTNGDLCENGQHHYTIIAFVCGAEGVSNKPFVMEQNPCQLIIHWNTDLVCEKRIKCVAMDDDDMNLSSLIKSSSNYVVKANKTEFHINICRPLVPEPSLACAHGSAVCKATLDSNKKYINEVSLGFPKESPVLDANRDTVLRYVGGSLCPEDPTKLISSNFTFPCDVYSDKGFPEFKDYKDCTYIFEWKTSITCGAAMGTWTSPCIIKDHLSHEYDLSPLYKSQPIYHVRNKQGKDYSISICGGGSFCNGSAVCQGSNGYGSLANVIFDYGRDIIKLQYSNGDKCVNTSYSSGVRFICVKSMGIGEPKPLWESQCNAEFEWYTNVTCACKSSVQHSAASLDALEHVKMFSPGHAGTVAGVVLSVIALVTALFYFRHPDKRTCLRSCWHPFASRRSSGRVQYCRVDTTEEARLLLDVDPTQCQTDSDDDLLVA